VWIGGNVGSSFERVDVDAARFGIYVDGGTRAATFQDLRLGSAVVTGVQTTTTAMVAVDSHTPSESPAPNGSPQAAAAAQPLTVTPSAHNFYLRVVVETGAIGFIALLAYLAILLVSAIKRSSRVSWQWPLAFALVLIAGFAIDTEHWRGLWIYAAVLAATMGPQQTPRDRRAWPKLQPTKDRPHRSRRSDRVPAVRDPSPAPSADAPVAAVDAVLVRGRALIENRVAARGPLNPEVAGATHELATVYHDRGDHDQADLLYLDALRIYEASLPRDSPVLLWLLEDLAGLRRDQGRGDEASAIYRRALTILASTHPVGDPLLERKRIEYGLPA
jgi:hypothetical protein